MLVLLLHGLAQPLMPSLLFVAHAPDVPQCR